MKLLKQTIQSLMNTHLGKNESFKKIAYISKVKEYWRQLVSQDYLDHTNAVFLLTQEGKRQFVVYVDDSMFAADLNAQKEIFKMRLNHQLHEKVDDVKIYVSKSKYKHTYPFKSQSKDVISTELLYHPISLEEKKEIQTKASIIKDIKLREACIKAAISDLEVKNNNL